MNAIETRLADEGVATLRPPSPISPTLAKLLGYWEAWRHGRAFPSRQDVNPGTIRDILPALMLIEVIDGGRDYLYRIAGSGVVRLSGIEPTGKLLSTLGAQPIIARTRDYLETSGQAREPLLFRSRNSIIGHCSFGQGETLVLPLSRDGEEIDYFLLGGDVLLPEHMGGGSAGLVIGPARIPRGVPA